MTDACLFIQLLVGFFLIVKGSSCPITLSPTRVVVKYGDPVSINCTADALHEGMGWEAPEGGTGLMQVNHLTWSVASVTNKSMSECFINPVSAAQCSKPAVIVLYSGPQRVYISSNSSDGTMVEGQVYYLICEVDDVAPVDFLTVKWFKDNKHFYTETFNSSINRLPSTTKMYFTPTRENNDFRCEAHLDLTPEGPYINVSSQIFTTNVQFGPEMNCSTVEIAEGNTLDSSCPVLGNPAPHVKWLRHGQQINSNVPLSRHNAGSYYVEAEGFLVIKMDVQVYVLYGPEVNCSDSYTVLEHTHLGNTCTLEGYPQPIETLYKDEDMFTNQDNITRNDAGQYTYVASTESRSVNQTFEIIVHYPPSQIFELEDSQFTVGSSLSLKCSASGNPRPQYYWTYYNTTNVSEENDDGVSRLVIHNATAHNIGNYTCLALNEHGHVSKTARLTVEGVEQECPLQIKPDRMLLEYNGERQSATCQALNMPTNVDEIYWQDYLGRSNSSEWIADTRHWDPRPVCKARFKGIGTCIKTLDFTLYKKPDSVSISTTAHKSTLKEGHLFTLVCEITSVAPAKSVSVRWYQGNETFTPPNEVHVTCDQINETRMNVNMSFSTNITANRTHNRAEFFCEAVLDLMGAPLIFSPMSRPLNITVHYPPTINTTKLSSTFPIISGYAEDLVCDADGNPPPNITWISNVEKSSQPSEGVLSVTEAGTYKCEATNHYGSDSREVEVILKVDYLPLIAGFVAVTVVVISIMFVFIYSIYYKNTKMRRYSLKNPKLSGHNGDVAHNGWEWPLPMTKLS